MAQSSVPVSLALTPSTNPDYDPTGVTAAPNDEPDIISALDSGGGTDSLTIVSDPSAISSGIYILNVRMDALADPGVDTGHALKVTMKLRDFGTAQNTSLSIDLRAPADSPTFDKQWFTALDAPNHWDGDLYTGPDLTVFTELVLTLTEAEVQAFRAAGGYTDCGVFIFLFPAFVGTPHDSLIGNDYDFIELVAPSAGGGTILIQVTQTGGYEVSGSGADYTVQSGGYEVTGGGLALVPANAVIQSGGYELTGGGVYGGNVITQSGGYLVSGGGRDNYFLFPDISGIYVIEPNKRDDTWYDRTNEIPDATFDVKIPDPFVSFAFLPKDS